MLRKLLFGSLVVAGCTMGGSKQSRYVASPTSVAMAPPYTMAADGQAGGASGLSVLDGDGGCASPMEQLADKGNGNAYYLDSIEAAKRVFSEQLTATLEVAAKDVKLQVEFDPAQVSRYRLIGYENRDVADNDFRKDAVDGGEMGWGHQVTAMYEIELTPAAKQHPAPLGTVRIRHKQPDGDTATEAAFAMASPPALAFDHASADLRFAFAVAAFADILRGGSEGSLDAIREHAVATAGDDKDRAELVALIDRARSLRGTAKQIATEPATAK